MNLRRTIVICVLTLMAARSADAEEPNETFGASTILAPGVLTVSDELTQGSGGEPDTMLGIRNQFGLVYHVDDDGSPLGNGTASGVGGVDTNSGSIDFSITGYPDEFFEGGHGEEGDYEVFVDVYDFFGDPVDSFSEVRTLTAGVVHDFTYSDFNWLDGTYDVYIDNTVGLAADIDFFTFTGLSPGASFTAETLDPQMSDVDTVLGWFDSSGTFLAEDDDAGEGVLSKLTGAVPNDGALTFAVTGFGDDDFVGSHSESGSYQLQLTIGGGVAGDFNGDSLVNAQDLTVWRQSFSASSSAADADGDDDSDGQDLLIWQQNLGEGVPATVAAQATPEPSGLVLLAAALAGMSLRKDRRGWL